jgi:predicted dehydrogenase
MMASVSREPHAAAAPCRFAVTGVARPRLGFLGVGWIGRHRMEAIVADGAAEVVAIADGASDAVARALEAVSGARALNALDELLDCDLDGIVIATPSALHAQQGRRALASGRAVFCQKPLARTAAETRAVVEAARDADRLLGVDLSYRHTAAMQRIHELVRSGALGNVFAVDLVFHNAYGPDRDWFRNVALSGGGCVIDLGTHLIDLALFALEFPRVTSVASRLYARGHLLSPNPAVVEDYAVAQFELETGTMARLACSWNLSAGRDAVIEATFHGTRGGASMRNVNGSFYDFVAEHFEGTRRTVLVEPPDAWGGRAAVAWARQLAVNARFDSGIEHIVEVAAVIDRIYGR